MCYLELEKEATIQDLENLFSESLCLQFQAPGDSCSVSSISVAGKEKIFIGQIKKEAAFPRGFWVWAVADNLTRGSALNAFEIAKTWLSPSLVS
jgi:aspartate-semialdehyde dehydrogenase